MNKGKRCARAAKCHVCVQRIFCCVKGVRSAVMAIEAVHGALLSYGGPFQVGGHELSSRAVIIGLADPWNGLVGRICSDVFDLACVCPMNSAQVGEGVAATDMQQCYGRGLGILLIISIRSLHH